MRNWIRWSIIPAYLIVVALAQQPVDGLVWPFLIFLVPWVVGYRLGFESRQDPDTELLFWRIVEDQ